MSEREREKERVGRSFVRRATYTYVRTYETNKKPFRFVREGKGREEKEEREVGSPLTTYYVCVCLCGRTYTMIYMMNVSYLLVMIMIINGNKKKRTTGKCFVSLKESEIDTFFFYSCTKPK